ncbi:MAG: hypothetical protein SH818_02300 [Saprospiraceae bacterium]|nr:hypothetical protein [Saprospiraceae bacterium]
MDRKKNLLEFLEKDPTSSFLKFALAKEYENENNPIQSIEIFEALLLADPAYTGAYYHLGKQYVKIKEIQQAIRVYHAGIAACKLHQAWHDGNELRSALEELEEETD